MNGLIEYHKNIENWSAWGITPETIFESLKNEIDWEQRDAPRMECFLSTNTNPYTYGSGRGIRTYYPKEYGYYAKLFKNIAEHFASCEFEACFLNYYKGPRDHLGWHADDSDVIDMNRPIVVISLGSAREIWFREKNSKEIEKLLLEPNSVLIMKAGMQLSHEHRIPKHNATCGERISLTFRGLK